MTTPPSPRRRRVEVLLTVSVVLGAAAACSRPDGASEAEVYEPRPEGTVTFTRDIAPIVFDRCVICHRPGEVAPFSLLTYEDVKRRAKQIGVVTESRYMPPWKPEPLPPGRSFVEERRLSTEELGLIQQWVAEGAREGDPADLPPAPEFPSGWLLGEPDLVLHMPETYTLPPEGQDVFRNFVIPTHEPALRWVRGVEFRPTNRRVVHHTNLRVDPTGTSRALDEEDPEPGFTGMAGEGAASTGQLVGWHPGRMPLLNPPDVAWPLPAGADLLLLLHMLPTGKPEDVQFAIGLHFADEPPTTYSAVLRIASKTIDIPPGEANYVVRDTFELPVDVRVFSMRPHAHYLGKDLRGYAELPDGTVEPLIRIPDWDFNWQDEYRPTTPIELPAGTKIQMVFSFDNSAENVNNPNNPPQRVLWGGNTRDEMAVLFTQVLVDEREDMEILQEHMHRHERELTLAGWEQMLREDPDSPDFQRKVAIELRLQGRDEEAVEHLREAVRIAPDDAPSRNDLGLLLSRTPAGLDEAIVHLREAVRLEPDAISHKSLGTALLARGELEQAVAELRESLRLEPDAWTAQLALADALRASDEPEPAIEAYRSVLAARPGNARAHLGLGLALQLAGRSVEAAEHLRDAIRLEPGNADWHRALASALEQHGAWAEAVDELREAARLRPGWTAPQKRLAWILATAADPRVRDPAQAIALVERVVQLKQGDNASIRDTLAAALAASGRFEEAVANAQAALERIPKGWPAERAAAIRERLELYRRGLPYVEDTTVDGSGDN